jgi:hypothetical protein
LLVPFLRLWEPHKRASGAGWGGISLRNSEPASPYTYKKKVLQRTEEKKI